MLARLTKDVTFLEFVCLSLKQMLTGAFSLKVESMLVNGIVCYILLLLLLWKVFKNYLNDIFFRISPAVTTYILNEILTTTNQSLRALYESYNYYIFPVFNPDGYNYTLTNVSSKITNAYYFKNRSTVDNKYREPSIGF